MTFGISNRRPLSPGWSPRYSIREYDASTPTVWLSLASGNSTNGGNYLYPFSSTDGATFRKLTTSPVYGSTIRDPALYLVEPGGVIWVYADAGGVPYVLKSVGGIDEPLTVVTSPSPPAGTTAVWAGNWYTESGTTHLVLPATTASGGATLFQIYETHATATDFSTWSAYSAIGTSGWASSTIDPCLVKSGSTYYLFWKDDGSGTICLSTSSSPFSGYTVVQTGDWAGWKAAVGGGSIEGPQVVQLPSGNWRIYFTQNNGLDAVHVYSSDTSDSTLQTGWSSPLLLSSFDGYNHPLPILNF